MVKDKIIQKLLDKSVEINNIEISSNKIKDVPIEDFIEFEGDNIEYLDKNKKKTAKLIYNNNCFYKKHGAIWLRTKVTEKIEEPKEIVKNNSIEDRINIIEAWIRDYIEFKDLAIEEIKKINERMTNIERLQGDFMKEIKDYIDNKL